MFTACGWRREPQFWAQMNRHDQAHALLTSAGVHKLVDRAILRVTGDDARTWLNGQITNDVREVRPGSVIHALVVDLKGRIIADLHVLDEGESFSLIVPRAGRAALLEHLDGYVIMEDVELEADERAVLTVQGPDAAKVVGDRAAWPCDRLGVGGRDVLANDQADVQRELGAAAEALGGGVVDEGAWELARLRARIPRFGAELGPTVYPQEAGLDTVAVSFAKGCYVGQEPIVMLKHRGRCPRKLCALSARDLTGSDPTGSELVAEGRVAGAITSAALDPDTDRWLALGYVKRAHASVGVSLTLAGRDDGELTIDAVLANDERSSE